MTNIQAFDFSSFSFINAIIIITTGIEIMLRTIEHFVLLHQDTDDTRIQQVKIKCVQKNVENINF